MRFALPLSILAAGLVAGAAGVSATAADSPKHSRACFLPRDIRNWKVVDHEQALNISTDRKEIYQATFFGSCPGVDFNDTLAIKTQAGSTWICEGDDAYVYVRDLGDHRKCDLQHFRKMSPKEVAGLTKMERP